MGHPPRDAQCALCRSGGQIRFLPQTLTVSPEDLPLNGVAIIPPNPAVALTPDPVALKGNEFPATWRFWHGRKLLLKTPLFFFLLVCSFLSPSPPLPKGHRRMKIAKGIITNNKNVLASRPPGVWRRQLLARQIQTLDDCLALILFGQTQPASFFPFFPPHHGLLF